jgi:hypothetical protein
MKITELKKGSQYKKITDNKIILVFTGKISKLTNNGFNDYFKTAYFKPLKTEANKNWFHLLPKIITLNFNEGAKNDILIKYNH